MRTAAQPVDPAPRFAALWVGGLIVGSGLLTALWLRFGLPVPGCRFREWTGLPCATCGSTRMVRALIAGDPGGAFLLNPLVFSALVLLGVGAAFTVVTGRVPGRLGRREAIIAGVMFVAGWAYQIWRAL